MAIDINFDATFRLLTEDEPFPWQVELFQRFLDADFPNSCNLPTGLGKTSVVAIWLVALASRPEKIPRRVHVVNRRTVVDQTTNEVAKLRHNLTVAGLSDQLTKFLALPFDISLPWLP